MCARILIFMKNEKLHGRSLLLGEFDSQVQEYVKQLRRSDGIVSASIVVAAAKGIVKHYDEACTA